MVLKEPQDRPKAHNDEHDLYIRQYPYFGLIFAAVGLVASASQSIEEEPVMLRIS